jgi:hypothetical protein
VPRKVGFLADVAVLVGHTHVERRGRVGDLLRADGGTERREGGPADQQRMARRHRPGIGFRGGLVDPRGRHRVGIRRGDHVQRCVGKALRTQFVGHATGHGFGFV